MLKKEIIGLMSGTSLDGLDIAHVKFFSVNNKVTYKLMKTGTVAYPNNLLEQLRKINSAEIDEIQILNKKIGSFFKDNNIPIDKIHFERSGIFL